MSSVLVAVVPIAAQILHRLLAVAVYLLCLCRHIASVCSRLL